MNIYSYSSNELMHNVTITSDHPKHYAGGTGCLVFINMNMNLLAPKHSERFVLALPLNVKQYIKPFPNFLSSGLHVGLLLSQAMSKSLLFTAQLIKPDIN